MAADKKGASGGASGSTGRKKKPVESTPKNTVTYRKFQSSKEIDQFLFQEYQAHINDINENTQGHLRSYKSAYYGNYNDPLRALAKGGKPLKKGKIASIQALDQAFFALSDNIIVQRGFHSEDLIKRIQEGNMVGQTFDDAGYMSTSLGNDFGPGGTQKTIFIRIKVPKGTKVAIPDPKGLHAYEQEVIIHRNARIRITAIKEYTTQWGDKQYGIAAEYVGEGDYGDIG